MLKLFYTLCTLGLMAGLTLALYKHYLILLNKPKDIISLDNDHENHTQLKISCYEKVCLFKFFVNHYINGDEISQQEGDFKLTVEKIEILSFNKEFINNPVCVLFQYNTSNQAVNASGQLLQDLGFELKDNIEIYGIEDGEPRLISTANDVNVCDILTSGFPELEDLFKIGNFTKCPMKAGWYGISNAVFDMNQIPPSIPRGKFMLDIKSYNGTTELIHSKAWLLVEDVPAKSK